MNVFICVIVKIFYSVKGGIFQSTQLLSPHEWKIPSFTSWKYFYHCTLLLKFFQSNFFAVIYSCILKTHSHSKSGGSIWASLECQCCFWIAAWRMSSHIVRYDTNPPAIQKLQCHSREAQIKPPLFECGFRIQAIVYSLLSCIVMINQSHSLFILSRGDP
jgi:hypothetical protein